MTVAARGCETARARARRAPRPGPRTTRLLVASMLPLALAIAAEVYIVARIVLRDARSAGPVAGSALGVFLRFWFVLPRTRVGR